MRPIRHGQPNFPDRERRMGGPLRPDKSTFKWQSSDDRNGSLNHEQAQGGTFSATFFLVSLVAMELEDVGLDEI
jgi:hypothetical protein